MRSSISKLPGSPFLPFTIERTRSSARRQSSDSEQSTRSLLFQPSLAAPSAIERESAASRSAQSLISSDSIAHEPPDLSISRRASSRIAGQDLGSSGNLASWY